nr:MAG TPA: protein of unknown function (DUF5117) [Caudoviricetes sp.]
MPKKPMTPRKPRPAIMFWVLTWAELDVQQRYAFLRCRRNLWGLLLSLL